MKKTMKQTSFLFLYLALLFSPIKTNSQSLYKDVTTSNLPIQAVSGPGMDIESADIDNDGDKDIIIAREYSPNKILINNGVGIFLDESWRIPQFSYDSEDIVIADFDRDGDIDILFASEDNAVHEFYLNRGNGYFDNANNRIPNFISNAVITLDLNNDNFPDLIFGSNGGGFPSPPGLARVLINNGNATFSEDSTRLPRVLMVPQDIKAADIDNDGDKDLIFGCEDGNKIFINNGNGYYNDETLLRLPLNGDEETRKVSLADIDNDGDLDIFFANVNFIGNRNPQNRLLKNNGSGFYADVTETNLPADHEHTLEGVFLDFNFDGKIDLLTANSLVNRPVKAFFNLGNGIFADSTSKVLPPNTIAEGLGAKIDYFNNDTLPDIYIVHRRNSTIGGNDLLFFRESKSVIGINNTSSTLPKQFKLYQNFPNPFNPVTEINFNIKSGGFVKLAIYNSEGKLIENLYNGILSPGSYNIKWNAFSFSSGIYYYKMETVDFKEVKKMILLK